MSTELVYEPSEEEARDPARRILLMVHELHRLGYEQVRVFPSMAPSGMHWRCKILLASVPVQLAASSTGSGAACFGWKDAENDDPPALAHKFIERFPEAARGRGADPSYVKWFVEMLRATAPKGLPIELADWELPEGVVSTIGCAKPVVLPLAPPFKP